MISEGKAGLILRRVLFRLHYLRAMINTASGLVTICAEILSYTHDLGMGGQDVGRTLNLWH